jgi:hypothetical protein
MRNYPERSTDSVSGRWNRLNSGLDVLEEWSRTASQSARNLVYRALFAVGDGSLFRTFQTMTYRDRPDEITIYLREDLVVTISRSETDFFDIAYIGSPEDAPGFGRDRD